MDFQFYSSSSPSKSFFNYPQKHQTPPPPPPSQPPHYRSSLSVRKVPAKPWKKYPIAPLPPIRPKVYKVDALDFKQVVQELTTGPEFQPRRLQSLAPPPLSVVSSLTTPAMSSTEEPTLDLLSPLGIENMLKSSTLFDLTDEITKVETPTSSLGYFPLLSPQGFGFSITPSHDQWCSSSFLSPGTLSSPFLSPGTLSLFDQSNMISSFTL